MMTKHSALIVMCVGSVACAQDNPDLRQITLDSGGVLRYLAFEPANTEGASVFVGLPPGNRSEQLGRIAFDTYWKLLPEAGWIVLVPVADSDENVDDQRVLDEFFDALPGLYGTAGAKPHVAGVSSGGRLAYQVAVVRGTDRLSSLVLMPGCAQTEAELSAATSIKDLETRMFVGADDDASWRKAVDVTLEALQRAGARVRMVTRENEGHILRITAAEFRNVMDTLKASRATAPGAVLAQDAAIAAVLDDFHLAASQADGKRYFEHFTSGAVFLGTDATERWTVDQFRAYAEPYFAQGKGWTYVVTSRHITVSEDGRHSWFDESLNNEKYGECRGSGVLLRIGEEWKIAQYNLTVPIPNDMLADVARDIRKRASEK
jgi:hypothetical protein